MVWGGVCDNGLKTPLIVIPQGVKVNSQVYIELLETQVLGWINEQDWQQGYCFMQDGAPSHTSRITQAWCKENFSTFWDKETWPPSSPDLNPMDFSVWSILERKVGTKNYPNVTALTQALQTAWAEIPDDMVRRICKEATKRF